MSAQPFFFYKIATADMKKYNVFAWVACFFLVFRIQTEYDLASRTDNGVNTPQKLRLGVHYYPVVDALVHRGPKTDSFSFKSISCFSIDSF